MTNVRNLFHCFCLFLGLLLLPGVSAAQTDALSLSVTPTLFDVSVEPGQVWRSSIRVINPNTRDIVVYAQPVLLSSNNERGVGSFTPVLDNEQLGVTLAEWIDITDEPVEIAAQETVTLPFSVPVPADAAPGGQYAAILITTQPLPGEQNSAQIRTSQAVSALFFMRVEGAVVEEGSVRSFRVANRFVQRPENDFILRFENQGTVHLQPQGDITIFNMWDQQRGVIPVNQRTEFGKVLPDSIREYNFSWTGEYSLLDIGRYRAEVTLGYGSDNKSFVEQTLYFWVIPVYGLLITIGSVVTFFLLVAWLVRMYIRRMLQLAGITGNRSVRRVTHSVSKGPELNLTQDAQLPSFWRRILLPLRTATDDIVGRWRSSTSVASYLQTLGRTMYDYRWSMVAVAGVILCILAAVWFYQAVAVPERSFESRVVDHTDAVTSVISSEDLYLEKLQQNAVEPVVAIDRTVLTDRQLDGVIEVVNVSDVPGAAASLAHLLTPYGVTVQNITTDMERTEQRSIIVYSPEQLPLAKELSQALGGALLSVRAQRDTDSDALVIYVGFDVLAE